MEDIWCELMSGGMGGAMGVFVGAPFDFVKVRLQSFGQAYSGPFDCLRKSVRQEGLLAVYAGLFPPLVNSFILNAIMFGGYGHGQYMLENQPIGGAWKTFIAGSYAGLISVTALVPFDLVKCQMQVDRVGGSAARFQTSIGYAREIVHKGGWSALYRGTLVTIARDSPTTGAYFLAFEWLEVSLPRISSRMSGETATFLAGGLSGQLAWLLAYPFDTVKTWLQTLPLSAHARERTVTHAFRAMYQKHGVGYFFRGLGTCLVRAFPVNSITFVVYKRLKELCSTKDSRLTVYHG